MVMATSDGGGFDGGSSALANLDYGNIGGNSFNQDEDFDFSTLNSNPFARSAATQGLRGAFRDNPIDFNTGPQQGLNFQSSIDDLLNPGQNEYGFSTLGGPLLNYLQDSGLDIQTNNITLPEGGGQANQYLLGSNVTRQQLQDLFGGDTFSLGSRYDTGDTDTNATDLTNYIKDSTGKELASYYQPVHGSSGWLSDLGTAMPYITAAGIGAIAGPVASGLAGGGLTGTVAGGAAGSGASSFVLSGGDLGTAGKSALLGGLTAGAGYGLNSGTNSLLDDYVTKAGNNPSAYTQGFLNPEQAQLISQGVANVGTTAIKGGDIKQAGLQQLLGVGGSLAQPYLSSAVDNAGTELSRLFNGGNMPDDFNVPGGFSYAGPNSNLDSILSNQGISFNGSNQQGPMSTTQPLQQQNTGLDFGNMDFNQFNTGSQEPSLNNMFEQGGMGLQKGGDYGFQTPSFNPSAPTPAQDGNYMDYFKKNGSAAALQFLKQSNPQLAALLGGVAGQQGGQKPGQMSYLEGGAGVLASLYAANQQRRGAQAIKSNLDQQAQAFSADSPYAQQLRQQLDRKDAAAGRRSQYGPREVELQARLAEIQGRQLPGLAQQQMAAQGQINQARLAPLQNLMYAARATGGGKELGGYLENLFGNLQTPFGPGTV